MRLILSKIAGLSFQSVRSLIVLDSVSAARLVTGRCKQWNGLIEWNTGLDYRTELFSFLDKFLLFMIYKYQATMDDCIMTTVAYCSVFINK